MRVQFSNFVAHVARAACMTLVLASVGSAIAAPSCPRDADVLTVEGVGTIYSSGGYEISDASSVFNGACLERDGWLIRFPVLTVIGEGDAARLSADTATVGLEGRGVEIGRAHV